MAALTQKAARSINTIIVAARFQERNEQSFELGQAVQQRFGEANQHVLEFHLRMRHIWFVARMKAERELGLPQ